MTNQTNQSCNGKWTLGNYSRWAGNFTYSGIFDSPQQACASVGMKAWSYAPQLKKYVPYDPKFGCCRVECATENNSYSIENTYHVAFRPKIEFTGASGTKTFKPANPSDNLIKISVVRGQKITVSANQPVTWKAVKGAALMGNLLTTGNVLSFLPLDLQGSIELLASSICENRNLVLQLMPDDSRPKQPASPKDEYISFLWEEMEKAGITKNKNELAAFLASSDHETQGGNAMTESSQYSLKRWRELAKDQSNIRNWLNQHKKNTEVEFAKLTGADKLNIMYAGMNGNNQPGDGYKYRGRGGIHLTGKANYQSFANYMSRPDIMSDPDLVASNPKLAAQSAVWYWTIHKPVLRKHGQRGNWDKVRNLVNGGKIGREDFTKTVGNYLKGKGTFMRKQ